MHATWCYMPVVKIWIWYSIYYIYVCTSCLYAMSRHHVKLFSWFYLPLLSWLDGCPFAYIYIHTFETGQIAHAAVCVSKHCTCFEVRTSKKAALCKSQRCNWPTTVAHGPFFQSRVRLRPSKGSSTFIRSTEGDTINWPRAKRDW